MPAPPPVARALSFFAALFLLSGCANIHNDQTRTKVEGTMAGATAGGILGGVIGGVVSMGSPSYIAEGAIVGAQMGGGAGYAYGSSVAYKKAKYASREAWLKACIDEAALTAQRSRAYGELARRLIAKQEGEAAVILDNGKILPGSEAKAAALRKELDTSITNLNGAIKGWDAILQAHRNIVQHSQPSPAIETLGQQIDDLQRHQDDLRQDLDGFTSLRKSLGP